jgi:heme/copper-type cytochrome/quinol oxidase subunit 2
VPIVDPEFVRVTTRVLAIGFIVLTIGTVALYLAFRSFGDPRERSGAHGLRMLLGAVAFILVICLVLLRWSVVRQ